MSASGKNDAGLMSSAGLVRYFDEEEQTGLVLGPRHWLAIALSCGLGVQALNMLLIA